MNASVKGIQPEKIQVPLGNNCGQRAVSRVRRWWTGEVPNAEENSPIVIYSNLKKAIKANDGEAILDELDKLNENSDDCRYKFFQDKKNTTLFFQLLQPGNDQDPISQQAFEIIEEYVVTDRAHYRYIRDGAPQKLEDIKITDTTAKEAFDLDVAEKDAEQALDNDTKKGYIHTDKELAFENLMSFFKSGSVEDIEAIVDNLGYTWTGSKDDTRSSLPGGFEGVQCPRFFDEMRKSNDPVVKGLYKLVHNSELRAHMADLEVKFFSDKTEEVPKVFMTSTKSEAIEATIKHRYRKHLPKIYRAPKVIEATNEELATVVGTDISKMTESQRKSASFTLNARELPERFITRDMEERVEALEDIYTGYQILENRRANHKAEAAKCMDTLKHLNNRLAAITELENSDIDLDDTVEMILKETRSEEQRSYINVLYKEYKVHIREANKAAKQQKLLLNVVEKLKADRLVGPLINQALNSPKAMFRLLLKSYDMYKPKAELEIREGLANVREEYNAKAGITWGNDEPWIITDSETGEKRPVEDLEDLAIYINNVTDRYDIVTRKFYEHCMLGAPRETLDEEDLKAVLAAKDPSVRPTDETLLENFRMDISGFAAQLERDFTFIKKGIEADENQVMPNIGDVESTKREASPAAVLQAINSTGNKEYSAGHTHRMVVEKFKQHVKANHPELLANWQLFFKQKFENFDFSEATSADTLLEVVESNIKEYEVRGNDLEKRIKSSDFVDILEGDVLSYSMHELRKRPGLAAIKQVVETDDKKANENYGAVFGPMRHMLRATKDGEAGEAIADFETRFEGLARLIYGVQVTTKEGSAARKEAMSYIYGDLLGGTAYEHVFTKSELADVIKNESYGFNVAKGEQRRIAWLTAQKNKIERNINKQTQESIGAFMLKVLDPKSQAVYADIVAKAQSGVEASRSMLAQALENEDLRDIDQGELSARFYDTLENYLGVRLEKDLLSSVKDGSQLEDHDLFATSSNSDYNVALNDIVENFFSMITNILNSLRGASSQYA